MFGHQDDQPAQQDSDTVTDDLVHEAPDSETAETAVAVAPADPAADSSAGQDDSAAGGDPEEIIVKPDANDQAPADEPQTDQPQDDQPQDDHSQADQPQNDAAEPETPTPNAAWQHPGTPLDSAQQPIKDVISPAGGYPKRTTFQYPAALADSGGLADEQPDTTDAPSADDNLIHVKKQALEELSPLVDKLDLPPEEKFRTIMMMIQASDDESLVKAAYEAAHAIEDEKARAQALLDVVNEVNYFTQQPPDQPSEQAI